MDSTHSYYRICRRCGRYRTIPEMSCPRGNPPNDTGNSYNACRPFGGRICSWVRGTCAACSTTILQLWPSDKGVRSTGRNAAGRGFELAAAALWYSPHCGRYGQDRPLSRKCSAQGMGSLLYGKYAIHKPAHRSRGHANTHS